MTDREWREKWLEIAEAFGLGPDDRTYDQDKISSEGLCYAAEIVEGWRAWDDLGPIEQFLSDLSKTSSDGYLWPLDEYYEQARCLFACLMAAMGQREARKLVEVSK